MSWDKISIPRNVRRFTRSMDLYFSHKTAFASTILSPKSETFLSSFVSRTHHFLFERVVCIILEIERQFHTIGKRQSTVIQRVVPVDVKRPDRPPPPIPPPYSKHKEFRTNTLLTAEGETPRYGTLTPPLPQRRLNLKNQSDVNLISFDGQNNSSFLSSLQPPPPPPVPIPRRQTIPYSTYPSQPNYGSTTRTTTTTTTTTNLLLITPTTDTTLDELLSYSSNNSKEELN